MDIDREDILIARATGREASTDDWVALRAIAARDQRVWSRLAHAFEDETRLRRAAADAVERALARAQPLPRAPGHVARRAAAMVPWLGWLAAGLLAAAWLGRAPPAAAPAAVSAPVDGGLVRVVGELPRVLISTEPLGDGRGILLTYVRQQLESVEVDELYAVRRDDAGGAWNTVVHPVELARAQSF